MSLLSVDEALSQILAHFSQLSPEWVALDEAFDRVLAQDAVTDISLPPFANSSMDGFAIIADDIQAPPVTLQLVMDIPAGTAPERAIKPGEAARIMTGAPLPEGADAVVPVEQTDQVWNAGDDSALPPTVTIRAAVRAGDYIRPAGEDIQAGQSVLKAGTLIGGAELGVLAGIGWAQVPVIRQPRVAVISTGDELLSPHEPLTPGKIRDTNSYALSGLVRTYGGIPVRLPPAGDTLAAVRSCFQDAVAAQPDLILSSAGVSVGAFDVVRTIIEELGALNLWRVNIRPGKPLAFGHVKNIPYFGLPGNPVSSLVTFDVFVRPTLLKLGGRQDPLPTIQATTGEPMQSDGRRTYLRVTLTRQGEQWIAMLTGTQSSGALTSMTRADGLLIVPEGVTEILQNERFPVRLLRPLAVE